MIRLIWQECGQRACHAPLSHFATVKGAFGDTEKGLTEETDKKRTFESALKKAFI